MAAMVAVKTLFQTTFPESKGQLTQNFIGSTMYQVDVQITALR